MSEINQELNSGGDIGNLHATDIMPVNRENWKETRAFLLNVTEVLLDYIREQYDRESKILEFHHPAEMQQLIDLSIPEKPMNLGALVQVWREYWHEG